MAEDYFDTDLDQEAALRDDDSSDSKEKDSDYGEEFLAPKSAFAGKNLEVGAVHKVRIESIQDSEVVLKCIKSKSKSSDDDESDPEDDSDFYD